jgi:hypothetical protein
MIRNAPLHRRASATPWVLVLLLAAGCGNHRSVLAPTGDPPTLQLEARHIGATGAASIGYRLEWSGVKGRADHYLYAVNPASVDRVDEKWVSTPNTSFELSVPRVDGTDLRRARESGPSSGTTFAVIAVDGLGRRSGVQHLTFLNDNIAPEVTITSPIPSSLYRIYVPPHIEIHWAGYDADGGTTQLPVQYKYTLLGPNSDFPIDVALVFPDSVRRYYEPLGYAGWDSTQGPYTAAKYSNLVPGTDYLFMVVAQDNQGAFSQVFTLDSNMLNMRCTFANLGGPLLTFFNYGFSYTYPVGTYSTDPQYQVVFPAEVPASEPFPMQWSALPPVGASIQSYRWAIDIADVTDDTPRTDEATDLAHWSQPSLLATSAILGPYSTGGSHILYVEARDSYGLKSLGMLRVEFVASSNFKPLLIVDDTRFIVDQKSPSSSCLNPPIGAWPTAAELDTFLYARGGDPWLCYPSGTYSSPGIFNGYPFDTIGTRQLSGGVVPLSILNKYAHVIWITDLIGATYSAPPGSVSNPTTALRYMSQTRQLTNLATYVASGGQLWMVGSGCAYASLIPFNRTSNDNVAPAPGTTFSNATGELVAGRLMYDLAHWRSEIKVATAPVSITRNLGRLESSPGSYAFFPSAMQPKSLAAGDTFPPNRSVIPGNFYKTSFNLEYLSVANAVLEDVDPGPGVTMASTLDTLYQASGSALVPPSINPVDVTMTVYRGSPDRTVLFSGFDIWSYQRVECRAVVDAVLTGIWHLPYTPPATSFARRHITAWSPRPRSLR